MIDGQKIVIAGGNGSLGEVLLTAYARKGAHITVLSRNLHPDHSGGHYVQWDGHTIGDWIKELEGADAVINLAGETINTRFTTDNRQKIVDSRVRSTAVIGEAIGLCAQPPAVWVNAGGISIYSSSEKLKTEEDVPDGTDFLAQVSQAWESTFERALVPGTRKVQMRISSVLLSKGGVLAPLTKLTRWGLGGAIGSGRQYISWIHEVDFQRLVEWLIACNELSGIVHACSPHPVQNSEFMRELRKRLNIPIGLSHFEWSARLGARLFGTDPGLALSSHRVISKTLERAGFTFAYPLLPDALRQLAL